MQNAESIVVKTHWMIKGISIIGFLLFGWGVVSGIRTHASAGTIAMFVFFAAGCVFLWFLGDSFIEVNEENVLVSMPYGRYQILWPEVHSVKTDGRNICFEGQDKRVVISLAAGGREAQRAAEFIDGQCKLRGIDIQRSGKVPWTHLHARVKGDIHAT